MNERDELAREVFIADNSNAPDPAAEWEGAPASVKDYAYAIANGLIAAGYVKADHIEYAADHRHASIEFADEDGNLFADRDAFEWYFEEYGNCKRVQRHVTAWEPLT